MIFNKVDNSSINKNKKLNFSKDSSRTTNHISNLDNSDTVPLKTEIDFEDNNNLTYSTEDNDAYNIKIKQPINNNESGIIANNKKYFLFKLQLSVVLCIIYFLLFLISLPKRPMKIGKEKTLNELIIDNTNDNENINILLNDFKFNNDNNNIDEKNVNNNENKTFNNNNDNKNNYEITGYLIELKIDKKYIFRWLIGFLYFVVRCICFIYSNDNKTNYFLHKITYSSIQNFASLIFPLWMFFYDVNNNITYTNIKTEFINRKHISYYIIIEKQFSMIDYIEGIIPTLFIFLISITYNGIEQSIGAYFRIRKKVSKVI